MAVTLGDDDDDGAGGWSTVTVTNNTYYVSSSVGNNAWDGTAPAFVSGTTGPRATIDADSGGGMALLTNGNSDQLLLKCGDTFTENIALRVSGRSATEPMLLGTYGTGARPIIRVSQGTGILSFGAIPAGGNYWAIMGLELYGYQRDPDNNPADYDPANVHQSCNGIEMLNAFDWCLIEDCKFRYCTEGIGIEADTALPTPSRNCYIRRNVLHTCYQISTNGGNGIKSGNHIDDFVVEGNVIDHCGYIDSTTIWFICSAANATAGATYTNNGVTFTVAATIVGGTSLKCTKSLEVFPTQFGTLTKASGTGDASITYSRQSLTVPGNYGFSHNIYESGSRQEYEDPCDPLIVRNNIISRDAGSTQLRQSGAVTNNAWIQNVVPLVFGMSTADQTVISDNVLIEAKANAGRASEDGIQTPAEFSIMFNRADFVLRDNIFTNATGVYGGSGVFCQSGFVGAITDNILFNWPAPLLNVYQGGILTYNIISGGSGGSAYPTFTASISNGSGGAGYILDVTSISGTPLRVGQKIVATGVADGTFIIGLMSGTGGTGTYQVWISPNANSTQLVTSRSMTIGNWHLPVTGGSGSGAEADVEVTGGVITSVVLFKTGAFTYAKTGTGFVVGETISIAVPGVTGQTIQVGTISTVTQSGNKLDSGGNKIDDVTSADYTAVWPHPERTVATYMTSLGGTATTAAFLTEARLQSKANWRAAYTARAFNDYIRAGFGVDGGGEPEEPPPATLMPQACM